MFDSVLVICTGNICRSPMAEGLLLARLRERELTTRVESAGIGALVGRPAAPLAIELMRERGVDITGHRARQLTSALVTQFQLVLAMDAEHQRVVEAHYPTLRGRVHRLGRPAKIDVPDPHKKDRAAFEHALELIDRGLQEMGALLFAGGRGSRPR